MMLADHGAEVVRVDRPGGIQGGVELDTSTDILARSRRSITVDIKSVEGRELVYRLIDTADCLIEGFRPGVMERLGFGPAEILARNPKLVYGRMTGWGQDGPLAKVAGHDINYISLSGALDLIGREGAAPTPPVNVLGDFAGGGLMLAFGLVSALLSARSTGVGQVVDCAMSEGSSLLMSFIWTLKQQGNWSAERGTNELDTGAHYYDTYECADGRYLSIGAIEPKFYDELRNKLNLEGDIDFDNHTDRTRWPMLKEKLKMVISSKTQAEWVDIFAGSDACVTPVLNFEEAAAHPHNKARQAHFNLNGVMHPAPTPKYSATPTGVPRAPVAAGADTEAILQELGYSAEIRKALVKKWA
jgi:alpha-methylacyl-CoA racemase